MAVAHPSNGCCDVCSERLLLVDGGTREVCRNGCRPLGADP